MCSFLYIQNRHVRICTLNAPVHTGVGVRASGSTATLIRGSGDSSAEHPSRYAGKVICTAMLSR